MVPKVCTWNSQRRAACLGAVLAAIALSSCLHATPEESASLAAAPAGQETSLGDRCDQLSPGTKLAELGHTRKIVELAQSGQRLASRDASGWRLWDRATGETIARGTGSASARIDLAAETLLTTASDGLQIRRAVDGALKQTIPYADKLQDAKLSHDGTYVYAIGERGITAWDLAGKQLAQAASTKGKTFVHAASGELRIARAQPTPQVELVSLETGETHSAGAYEGNFSNWFGDGGHFVTYRPSEFLVYTKDVKLVQRIPWSHSTRVSVEGGGYGKNAWLYSIGTAGEQLEVYQVGSTTPARTYTSRATTDSINVSLRSSVISMVQVEGVKLIELGGDAPKVDDFPTGTSKTELVSVDAEGHVVFASGSVIHAGALPSSAPTRALGCGAVLGLAGWGDRLAVSSERGAVRLYSFRSGAAVLKWTLTGAYASATEFMGDGRYLLVRGSFVDPETMREGSATRVFEFDENDQPLRSHQVAEPSLSSRWTVQASPAANAPWYALSHCESFSGRPLMACDLFVRTLDGSDWRRSFVAPLRSGMPQLSPDGRRLTIPEGNEATRISTALYDGWIRTGELSGLRVDLWLSKDRLLATDMTSGQHAAKIIDVTGAAQATLAVPLLGRVRKGSDGVFHDTDSIYRDADGQVLWSLRRVTERVPSPDAPTALVAGRFVYVADDALFAEPYARTADERASASIDLAPAPSDDDEPE